MAKVFRNAELERRLQERMFARLAARHGNRIRREMAAQYRASAMAFMDGYTDPLVDGERLTTALSALIRDSYQEAGQRTARAIQEAVGRAGKRAVPMDPAFEQELDRYIRVYAAAKVVEIDATTRSRIAGIVRQGIAEGWTNRETAAAIRQLGAVDSMFRARTIARTESHSAAMAGNLESAAETGVVKAKLWFHAEDERVRDGVESEFDHTGVEPAQLEEPFIVSGERLMHPGDPAGSPGNIINCRCGLGYEV